MVGMRGSMVIRLYTTMHGMSTPPPLKNAEVYPRLTFTSFELVFQGVYLLDDDGVDDDDDDDDYACDYDYYDYHVHQNVPMEENKCLYTINIIYYLI